MNFSLKEDICLENNTSLLRPLHMDDAGGLLEAACSDPELMRYSTGPINSPELLKVYIDTSLSERDRGLRFPFLIIDKASGKYAGCTSYNNISIVDEKLEIGWTWLGKSYHRTGLNRSNKYLMLEYAFERLGCGRVELRVDERNQRSRSAVEALGAVYEGTLRHALVGFDGFRKNIMYYSILKTEWENGVRQRFTTVS
jgi:RimJ/RimL family protein N-acetyltransferase